jgi:GT2 family glycosyltransferase
LQQFLPSVLQSEYDALQVIVADNCSTDDSISFLQHTYPQVQIIQLEKNYGFARGYNEALKQVKSDYYVLLNSDVEVKASWIKPVIELMEGDKEIAACQPKILQYENRELFEYAGAAGGWLDFLGYPFARGRIFDVCENDHGQYDDVAPIFWASGAAMFVRSNVYHELGGLDEYFFAHQEEIDFCWRIQRAGHKIFCCPQSIVYHVGGGTLPKGNARKVFLNFRNNLIMMWKNLTFAEAFWKITFRLFLDTISAGKSLLAGEATYFTAVFRAHFAFFYWLWFEKKKNSHGEKKNLLLRGYYQGSIVWAHFIKGKKTFKEIVKKKTELFN